MNFKAYDILSSLVPGFLMLLAGMQLFHITFDKDMIIPYTAVAFLLGNVMNTVSSWLEGFYYWTWGGKPSSKLIGGKGIWKVRFYAGSKVKQLLLDSCGNPRASNDELFAYALRQTISEKECKADDMNAAYAFARSMLTTVLIGTIFLLSQHGRDWRYYAVLIPVLFVMWLRAKQRGYFYAKEVLNMFLKSKQS